MSNTENPLFQDFKPAPQEPGLGAAIASGMEAKPEKQKRGRKKAVAAPAPVAKKQRKPRAPAKAASVPKLDMLRIVQATSWLKEEDAAAFDSLAQLLVPMGAVARSRVLAAIQKLFA